MIDDSGLMIERETFLQFNHHSSFIHSSFISLIRMIHDFIECTLAQVDDLAELKVSLAALHMLSQKASAAPSITERELMAHPAVRDGLSFAAIALRPALQRAVARGTLLCAAIGNDEPRYFANDEAGRRAADAIHMAMAQVDAQSQGALLLRELAREIERLEVIDVYASSHDDVSLVEEWLMRGYSEAEIQAAVKATLRIPRPKHIPPRTLRQCAPTLMAQPPAAPSDYYEVVVAKTARPPEEIVNVRERLGRWPNGREFSLVRMAASMFGLRATLDCLKRISNGHGMSAEEIDSLIPLLAEQEEAAMALQREIARSELYIRELILIYESSFGMPPTSMIADEMRLVWHDVSDMALWRSVFQYAANQNKRSWSYVKKLLQQPSPDVFMPPPANETAQLVFNEYKRRVNWTLDASVAAEINALAQQIPDVTRWNAAFNKAAAANALRWDYIKKVLTTASQGGAKTSKAGKDGKRGQTPVRPGRTYNRPQVEYTDEQRAAAEERARKELETED